MPQFSNKHNFETDLFKSLLSTEGKGKDMFENVKHGIGKACADFIKAMRDNISEDDTIATGKLQASIQPQLPIKHMGATYQIVFLAEDYWEDVDQGTKPKGYSKANMSELMPKISRWLVAKKGIKGTETEKKRLQSAFRISRAILKKGTIKRFGYKGSGFFSKEIDGFKAELQAELKKQTGKDVKIALQKISK